MIKNNLRTGDFITFEAKCGKRYCGIVVLEHWSIVYQCGLRSSLDRYNSYLESDAGKVVEVYRPKRQDHCSFENFQAGECLYQVFCLEEAQYV